MEEKWIKTILQKVSIKELVRILLYLIGLVMAIVGLLLIFFAPRPINSMVSEIEKSVFVFVGTFLVFLSIRLEENK